MTDAWSWQRARGFGRPSRVSLPARLIAVVIGLIAVEQRARAQDAFEIQVYEADTAAPGAVGLEAHANFFAIGNQGGDAPELPNHHSLHLTLEPHIGIASWCEAGAYIQTAIRGDGSYDFAGIKLRFKVRIPRRLAGVVDLALNGELSSVPQEYESHRFGSELRPIIDIHWRRLYVGINPIVAIDIGGPLAGHPQLEPAAKVGVRIIDALSAGGEYYAALGPVDRIDPLAAQAHRVFGALDANWSSGHMHYALNVAAGYGFTGPERVIVKAIFGFDYERD